MVNIKTISYGSRGEDVKKLQKALNENGYNLSVDGVFGANTKSALVDYQSKNNLSADGILGDKTRNSLYAVKTKAPEVPNAAKPKNSFNQKRPSYKKGSGVIKAEKELQNWENNKIGDYNSKYSEKIDSILKDILTRPDFTYNPSSDPLFQQYRSLYTKNGKKAMMDTLGKSTALTGGYTNSYAQNAAQETYHEYLNDLNGIMLGLRDRAYKNYKDGGDKLIKDISILRGLDGDDYKKYLNSVKRYYKDGDYLLKKLSNMSDREFKEFTQKVKAFENDRDYNFSLEKDRLNRQQFREEMEFKQREALRHQQNEERRLAIAQSRGSSKGNKSDKNSKLKITRTTIYPITYGEYQKMTGDSNILTEGEFRSSEFYLRRYENYREYLKTKYKDYVKGSKK